MKIVFEDIKNFKNFISCKDINPSTIPRFGTSGLFSAINCYNVKIKRFDELKIYSIDDNIKNYVIISSVNHSPHDWTGYLGNVKSLFFYLNEKYLDDLRNERALLVLDQCFEGYQVDWLWDFFHTECEKYKIPPKTIVYITGNMIVEEIYDKWTSINNINDKIKVIGYTHFEIDIAEGCRYLKDTNKELPNFKYGVDYKVNNLSTIKTFNCLNKRVRPNRVWLYKYLFDNNLLDKGLVSMNEIERHGYRWENKVMELEEIDLISTKLPLMVYNTPNNVLDDSYYITRFNDQVCLDTWVTVVSETHCADSDETLFISEKTFKPIACRHPFIIAGGKNSLKKLREMGYKTFEGFIDESYDELPTHERFIRIMESIKKIDLIEDKLSWYKSMENILEHNYNVLMNSLMKEPSGYVKLKEYYNNVFKK